MENNATKSVRLLLDSGVKFDEVEIVQETYGIMDVENWIDSVSFDENATPIIHYRRGRKTHHIRAFNPL